MSAKVRIVKAAFLIAPGARVRTGLSLACEGARIAMVAPFEECLAAYPGADVDDLGECALSAGFVNAHMHLYGVLAHGITPPVPITSFKGFLEDYWWPLVENLLDPAMIAAATRASALELIDGGVTSLCDVLEAPLAGGGGLDSEASVLGELGLRAVLSSEACERISFDDGVRVLEENAAFARSRPASGRISSFLCTHTSFTCSKAFMERALSLAAESGLDIQFHLNESRYEPDRCLERSGLRSAEWYDSIGVLGENILAAQCVQLSPREIELLAARRVRAVHVPLSNCEVGGGVAPVPELLGAGVVCGLGSDGYINDFLEVMRGAFLIHKGHRQDPSVMDAHTVWRMATEGGADAVFPGTRLGRLEPGAPADFIAIAVDDLPTPADERNLLDQLILHRRNRHVREVVSGGVPLKSRGVLLTGDFASARAESRREALRLWEAGRKAAGRNGA